MKKSELIASVATKTNLTKAETERVVKATFDTITDTLGEGDDVRIVGFGTFTTSKRQSSKGRNPRTGQPITIPASTTAKLRVSRQLKDAVNGR
jgi:DNA-binding protein HU-beta